MGDWSDDEVPASFSKPKASADDAGWSDEEVKTTSYGSGPSRSVSAGRGRGGSYGDRGGDRPAREPRPGDWDCECGANNFSSKTACFKCSADKPEGAGGGRPAREPRPGDWNCECGANNFSNKTACFKCSADKPEGAGGGRPAREPRPGDWNCECGANNFSNKTACFKCSADKPEGAGDSSARPAREPRPGDWQCECGKTCFASKSECFSCGAEKPESAGPVRAAREPRPGDWVCPGEDCGKTVFAGRQECFSCQTPKPEGLPGAEGDDKPREIYVPPEPTNNESEMFAGGIGVGINFDKYDKIDVKATGNGLESFKPLKNFEESGLRDFLLQNIRKSGYTKPTPVQKFAIKLIMLKRDLMSCAQTGSGKTAAFCVPILNMIMSENYDSSSNEPLCLIVAPTRELVIQIFEEARKFALGSWVKIEKAYGGTATMHQAGRIRNGCHILVATPGRLMDFVNKGFITFNSLRFLVLDEADRMLDMGFKSSIDEICGHTTTKKEQVQTLLFSATFPDEIQRLAATYLRDYVFLTVGIVGGACTDVEQEVIEVAKFKKRNKLGEILEEYTQCADEDRILVFVETKKTADFLASFMSETKISSTSIHGDRLQREREEALRDFRSGLRKVLIATNVAARGLDIKGVTHVINYDMPSEIADYVHRIGRTGRVGNRGKATSFYDADKDSNLAGDLVQILKDSGQPVPDFLEGCSAGFGGADDFGGRDIRKGVGEGVQQEADEDW